MEEGSFNRGIDRYDEEMCEGEKPRTTLVVLRFSAIPLEDSVEADACDSLGEAEPDSAAGRSDGGGAGDRDEVAEPLESSASLGSAVK